VGPLGQTGLLDLVQGVGDVFSADGEGHLVAVYPRYAAGVVGTGGTELDKEAGEPLEVPRREERSLGPGRLDLKAVLVRERIEAVELETEHLRRPGDVVYGDDRFVQPVDPEQDPAGAAGGAHVQFEHLVAEGRQHLGRRLRQVHRSLLSSQRKRAGLPNPPAPVGMLSAHYLSPTHRPPANAAATSSADPGTPLAPVV